MCNDKLSSWSEDRYGFLRHKGTCATVVILKVKTSQNSPCNQVANYFGG